MLEIDFSKNGEGRIFLNTNGRSIRLIECKNQNIKIGQGPKNENDEGEILAQLNFYNIESVDILIKHLLYVRDKMKNKTQLSLGC